MHYDCDWDRGTRKDKQDVRPLVFEDGRGELFSQFGARSKDAIARSIVNVLPEFAQHVPPIQKIWISENYRMGIFDAVAFAMTYYGRIE